MARIDKNNIEDILSLSPLQEGMLFHHLHNPSSDAYFEELNVLLQGELNFTRFREVWQQIAETNPALRTVFRWERLEKPVQIILKRHEVDAALRLQLPQAEERVNLQEVPFRIRLAELEQDLHEMTISYHHILYDGWSSGILLQEFFKLYTLRSEGRHGELPRKTPYKEYIKWLQRQDQERHQRYWNQQLYDMESKTDLPCTGLAQGLASPGGQHKITLAAQLVEQIHSYTSEHKVSLASLLYSAWAICLQAYNHSDEAVFGTTVSGRDAALPGIADMVGLFINTVPLRVRRSDGDSLLELNLKVDRLLKERVGHDTASLTDIMQYGGISHLHPLFDSIMVIENYPLDLAAWGQLQGLKPVAYSAKERTNYGLTVSVLLHNGIDIEFHYDGHLFTEGSIRRIAEQVRSVIGQTVGTPSRKAAELDWLAPDEQRQLKELHGERHPYPKGQTIQGLFEEQANRTPERTAVVSGDRTLSYGELNARANRLAQTLRARGIRPDTVVGLMTERSPDMLVGLLAILKAGGAYLPIHPQDPAERRRFMLHDSGAVLLLTQRHLMEGCGPLGVDLLAIEDAAAPGAVSNNPEAVNGAGDLAYVIYTSGSTGQPKGVGIEHASVMNLLHGLQQEVYGHTAEPLQVALLASYVFDASVQQIGSALLFGHTLHVLPEACRMHPRAFMSYIRAHGIQVCDGTPSHLAFLCGEGALSGSGAAEALRSDSGASDSGASDSGEVNALPSGRAADDVQPRGSTDGNAQQSESAAEIAAGAERAASAAVSGLRHLLVGGEVLTRSTVRELWRAFTDPELTIWNVYGPTECCVDAVIHPIRRTEFLREDGGVPGGQTLPIGRPLPNVQCYILGTGGRPQPIGAPGELCIGGEGVARGYVNRPELTAGKFTLNPCVPGGRMYRTGDLARWLPDGVLEYLGRIDGQVKIRGYRIETGEIEAKLLAHSGIREAAVTAFDEGGGRQSLCAYIAPLPGQQAPPPAELRAYLARSLPEYMLPSRFVAVERLPLTPSGKLDRRALPRPQEWSGHEAYAAPRDKREAALARIWQELLGVERVGLHDHFFELGGHSLKAMSLAARIHKELHVEPALGDLFAHPTLEEMAAHLGRLDRSGYSAIAPVPEQPYYAVSSAQKRLYVLEQLEGLRTGYNMPGVFRLSGTWDKKRMERAFAGMIGRHEALRTSFGLEGGEPVQYVHPSAALELEALELEAPKASGEMVCGTELLTPHAGAVESLIISTDAGPQIRRLIARFIRPFDLSRAPLLRAGLLPLPGGEALLLVDLHHIVSDGVSMGLFVREWQQLYRGEALQPLPIQYKDYAAWQQERLQGEELKRQEAYWLERLGGELPVLNLPADDPRPAQQSFEGGRVRLELPRELTRQLKALCAAEGVTLSMMLLAAWQVLLARYSGQEDVIVGMPVAGRPHADLDSVLGMFVNLLAMRNRPEGEKTFLGFLREVKEGALEGYESQDYPFEQLVQHLGLPRDLSRNPVFDVMFVMQNAGQGGRLEPSADGSVDITPYDFENPVSKFDLTLQAAERMDLETIELELEYASKLFVPATAERMIRHYEQLLGQIVQSPQRRLAELEVLTAAEKHRLLEGFNDTAADYPREQTIHGLFEEQAARTPDRTAVVLEQEQLTYRELNTRANALARVLRERGVEADTLVGILAERSLEMIVGILAILKAGGAYVPIDPEYPQERIRFMLEDTGTRHLLVTAHTKKDMPPFEGEIIEIDAAAGPVSSTDLREEELLDLPSASQAHHLAYVIYTSGTTGQPKGVQVEHRGVVNALWWRKAQYALDRECVLQLFSYAFDGFVLSLFTPLVSGAAVVLLHEASSKDPAHIRQAIVTHGITYFLSVPSLYEAVLEGLTPQAMRTLRMVTLAGEQAAPGLLRKSKAKKAALELANEYGPTEYSVVTTFLRNVSEAEGSSIGKPIPNTRVFILSGHGRLQPIGVPGELCISGDGLARGYLNRPELTAERFIGHPLLPGERLYRSGDLARWLPDGSLEYLGRIDQQVKIRGYRIELGEIEAALLRHGSIGQAAVIVREDQPGRPALCAYYVSGSPEEQSAAELRAFMSGALPGYMIPAYFVRLDALPLTVNGKLDRKALPEPDLGLAAGADYVPPRTPVQEALVSVWREVLGVPGLGIRDNFFELGGDSIKAIQVASRLGSHGLTFEMKDLFRHPVIEALSKHVKESAPQTAEEQGPASGSVPLTPIQEWFFGQYADTLDHFNQAVMLHRPEGIDPGRLEAVFERLIAHHDALRLRYRVAGGQVEQAYSDGGEAPHFTLEVIDLEQEAAVEAEAAIRHHAERLQRSLRLEHGPLVRLGLFRTREGDHLLIVIHHLVVDGVSWRILLEDLAQGYAQLSRGEAIALPPKTASYQRWSRKLRDYAAGKALKKEAAYWDEAERRTGAPLPKDHRVEQRRLADQRSRSVTWPAELTEELLTRAHRAYRTEINDLLLASLAMAVQRWSGNSEVSLHLEGHGREDVLEGVDVSRTVGWFTSLYPVHLTAGADEPLSTTIKQVKETLRRVPRKGIGYGLLKGHLPNRSGEGNQRQPDLLFNYLGQVDPVEAGSGPPTFVPSAMPVGTTIDGQARVQYALDVAAVVTAGRLTMELRYNAHEYEEATIERLAAHMELSLLDVVGHCADREEAESTPSDYGMNSLRLKELAHVEELVGRTGIQAIYPLTPMQQGMLFHSVMEPDSAAYFQQNVVALHGLIDEAVLEQALERLIARYDILRTRFVFDRVKEPLQVVRKHAYVPLNLFDLRHLAEEEKADRLQRLIREDMDRVFRAGDDLLVRASFVRTEDNAGRLIWSFHHLLMDGWCTSILIREFLALYHSLSEGRELQLPHVVPYMIYMDWLEDQDREEARAYWEQYLQGYEQQVTLPRQPDAGGAGYRLQQTVLRLEEPAAGQLQQLAARHEVTLNTVLQTVWGIVLQKYNQAEDVVFGSVVSGRPAEIPGIETMVGLFIHTIPVRIRTHPETTFGQLLKEVQEQALESGRYDTYPLTEIQSLSPLKQDLIHHLVAFENYPLEKELLQAVPGKERSLSIAGVEVFEQTNYDFLVNIVPGEPLEIRFEYNAHVYDPGTMDRLAGHLEHILTQVLRSPSGLVQDLTLLTAEEAERQLHLFNPWRQVSYPADLTIHACFEEQAARTPQHTALVYGGEQLTYGELNAKANQLARMLRLQGVKPDSIVGILADRSLDMIVGLLAILKAGGAYAPVDPDYPAERIRFMLEDSGCSHLLVQGRGESAGRAAFSGNIISLNDTALFQGETSNPEPVNHPSDLAYVIYTSGSTGTPKGVMIEHRQVIRLLKNDRFAFRFSERDVWTMFHSFCFDFSVWEMYGALLYGGTLIVVPKEATLDPAAYRRLLNHHGVTVVNQTPTAFHQLIQADEKQDSPLQVRYVIFGGEALQPALLQPWKKRYPAARLINMYGITETTVHVTFQEIGEAEIASNSRSIGSPIPTLSACILDKRLQAVPIGVPGELCISGDGLARGYLNRPELTAERFIDHPLLPGERLYRSGDLARWLPDGSLEYLGRIDHQVKIRGYRIELGEIEAALLRHGSIGQAAVIVREDQPGQPALCAYYVSGSREELSSAELRSFLSGGLPGYMIPAYFVRLDGLPLTVNGKLDRKALPEPAVGLAAGADYAPPRTPVQEALVSVWREVLGVPGLGIRDNFFELGGDSIKAIQVASRLGSHGLTFEMKDLFRHPVIEALSEYVKESGPQTAEEQGPASGSVPLTPIQEWFFGQYADMPDHFNQAVMLHRPGGIDPGKLETVFERLVSHHDALRLRYRVAGGQVEQAYSDGGEAPHFTLEVIDLEQEAAVEEDAEASIWHQAERLQRSLRLEHGPLVRLGLFRTREGDHLLIVIHHLVVDGVSWRILLEDLAQGYAQLSRGEAIALPPKTASYQRWSRKLRDYAAGKALKKEAAYWDEAERRTGAPLPKDHRVEQRRLADQRSRSVTWPAELTEELLTRAHRAYHTEINDLLLASLAMAVQRWSGNSEVSLHLEGHGREDVLEGVDVSRTVGWFTSLYPVHLTAGADEPLSTTIKQVKETLRRVPRKGIGYGLLKGLLPNRSGEGNQRQPDLLFNYLGQVDPAQAGSGADGFVSSAMPVGNTVSEQAGVLYALDVAAVVAAGRLTIELRYNAHEYEEATMERLAAHLEQSLREVVQHCAGKEEAESTPSDYGIEIDLGELELLLEE
ncbi:non-ribosomal peptide synthetase [Paenibacillus caseinilyticus]|uniref:non-ribosomal peptide synthetase n=1 Tax=Paenibacillus caseinilyticus TaxID=3098138 RepID=UPI0022B8BD75|nr:non-ribosomal peptide synthetase [Paenibacillus caseinilyticus]MCZ8521357.1 amino acid adenylation domain-containing protein [Paenibacillus caseinilyticus]